MNIVPPSLLDIESGKMLLVSGKLFDLYNPTPDMIDIEDIANALGKQVRWNGQISEFYSIAQHSCLVSWLAPPHLSFAAFMHDAAEAYTGDIIRPIKKMLAQIFYDIEHRIELAVCDKFGIAPELIDAIAKYDDQALNLEYDALFKHDQQSISQISHLSGIRLKSKPAFDMWDPETAKYCFLETYHNILNDRIKRATPYRNLIANAR